MNTISFTPFRQCYNAGAVINVKHDQFHIGFSFVSVGDYTDWVCRLRHAKWLIFKSYSEQVSDPNHNYDYTTAFINRWSHIVKSFCITLYSVSCINIISRPPVTHPLPLVMCSKSRWNTYVKLHIHFPSVYCRGLSYIILLTPSNLYLCITVTVL